MLLDRADWHPQNPHLVAGENAVAVVEVRHHMCFAHRVPQRSSDHRDAARQQRHQRDGHADPDGAVHGAGSELGDASSGAGFDDRRGIGSTAPRCPRGSGDRGRSGWWAAGRRRRQGFAVGVAGIAGLTGDGVGQCQVRFTALACARIGHRQRGRAGLAGLAGRSTLKAAARWDPSRGRRTRRRRTAARTGRAAGW